jgi:hypothetical protein
MLLSNLVAKQYLNSFDGHSGEEQFNRECVAKTMRVPISYICQLEEAPQSCLPASYNASSFLLPLQKGNLFVTLGVFAGADTLVPETIVGASDIPVHQSLLSRWLRTKTRSCLKSPDFQSLRSPSSIIIRVAVRQQNSVLSETGRGCKAGPLQICVQLSQRRCPCRERYWRPGTNWRGAATAVIFFFMGGLLSFLAFGGERCFWSEEVILWRKFR